MTNGNDKEQPVSEVLDFNTPSFVFEPNQYHKWRQQGYYLICKSCELQHAVYIGEKKIMVGIDNEGKPILKDR